MRKIALVLVALQATVCAHSVPAVLDLHTRARLRSLGRRQLLPRAYLTSDNTPLLVRNVPGDGSCCFHALAACMRFAETRRHDPFDREMRRNSTALRKLAAQLFERNDDTLLYIQDEDAITTRRLLQAASESMRLTRKEYCARLRSSEMWGGGPELCVLSNFYQRPIHVFRLFVRPAEQPLSDQRQGREFGLECFAAIGSPLFDSKEPLRILCADPRFPDVRPGEQAEPGTHFWSLLPIEGNDGWSIPQ